MKSVACFAAHNFIWSLENKVTMCTQIGLARDRLTSQDELCRRALPLVALNLHRSFMLCPCRGRFTRYRQFGERKSHIASACDPIWRQTLAHNCWSGFIGNDNHYYNCYCWRIMIVACESNSSHGLRSKPKSGSNGEAPEAGLAWSRKRRDYLASAYRVATGTTRSNTHFAITIQ